MRELLLTQGNLSRKLRQLLVLLALVLMPRGAWADYWDIAVQYGTDESNFKSTLVVGDEINSDDLLGDGTMSYDKDNNILTLNGVDLTCSYNGATFIHHDAYWDSEQVITIRLVGSNTITLGNDSYFFDGKGITFTAANQNASLHIVTQEGRTIDLFYGGIVPTYSDNLAYYPSTSEIKYAKSYSLWIKGTQVTDANKDNILGDGKWSFVHTSGSWTVNDLTLKGVSIENYSGNVISSSIDITIKVEQGSTNTISCADGYYPFYSDNGAEFTFDGYFDGTITGTNRKPFSVNSDYFFGYYSSSNGWVGPAMYFTDAGYTIAKCTNQWDVRINGNYLYDINHTDVFGDGSVSVAEADNGNTVNFTLNNANFKGPITADYYDNVVVDLTGVNYIRVIDSQDMKAFHRSNGEGYSVTFTGTGELRLIDEYITSADAPFTSHEYTSETHDASANFTTGGWSKEYITPSSGDPYLRIYKGDPTDYGITVAGTPVTSANAANILAGGENDGKVTFSPAAKVNDPNVLTLNGATIEIHTTEAIKSTMSAPLYVNLLGENTINCNGHSAFNVSSGLYFRTTGATPGSLTITNTSGVSTSNFSNVIPTYENSLGATQSNTNTVVISTTGSSPTSYGLTVGGIEVTSENALGITGAGITGTVTFNSSNNTLTLDNAHVSGTVSTSLTELNVHLKGHSVFNVETNTNNNTYLFNGSGQSLTLNYSAESIGDVLEGIGTANSYKLKVSKNTTTENYDGTAEIWKNSNSVENGKDYCKLSKPYLYVGDTDIDKSNYNSFGDYFSFDAGKSSLTISGIANNDMAYDCLVKSFLANLTVNISDNIIYQLKTGTSPGKVFVYTGTDTNSTLTLNIAEGKTLKTWWSTYEGDAGWIKEGFTNTNISTDLSTMGSSDVYAEASQVSGEYSVLFSKSTPTSYGITVAGYEVTSENASTGIIGDRINGTVTFTPASDSNGNINTLTLTDATLTEPIVSSLDNLTIHLVGSNNIQGTTGNPLANAISSTVSTATLTFTSDVDVNSHPTGKLLFQYVNTKIDGFSSITYNNGLGQGYVYDSSNPNSNQWGVGEIKYGLSIGDIQVTSANYSDIKDDGNSTGASYDNALYVLTLENATLTDAISWNNDANFKIELKGTNSITTSGSCITTTANGKNISFTRSGASSLELSSGTSGADIITGFSNSQAPTMGSGLFWFPTENGNNNIISALITTMLGGGEGTSTSPFIISSYDHLKEFANYVNSGILTTQYVKLNGNIDCTNKTDFVPIGNDNTHPFNGNFDGNSGGGYSISNLNYAVNSSDVSVGLFGIIDGGTVQNLTLSSCSFTGGNKTGAIAGYLNAGTIKNCNVNSCTIESGGTSIGAVVGYKESTAELSTNFYNSAVTVKTTTGGNTTTKSGQTQRGIGNGNDVLNQVMLSGTKTVTVNYDETNGGLGTVENAFYMVDATEFYVLPGYNFGIKAIPGNGFMTSMTLSDESIAVTDEDKFENGLYNHTEYTFTMPDDDVTANILFIPISGISVAGNVPAGNGSITGTGITGTVTFTPATSTTPNILTLDGATITGQIISDLGDLTIYLTGNTTLQAASTETSLINSTNAGKLSFDTNPTAIGSLEFKDNTGNSIFAGEPISGFTSTSYANGIEYDATNKKIGVTTYDIVVDGQDVTSANKTNVMGDGKIAYDSENRTLTLNDGTTISNYGINVESSSDLTVALNGSISVTGGTYAFNTNGGKIIFAKATGATSVNLTATCGDGYTPISFDNITLGSGLYWKPIDSETTVITTDPEFVIIDDYAMTDTRTITSTGTITYDTTNKVLTIDGFAKTDNSDPTNAPVPQTYIKSGVVGLTVKLKGNSAINYTRNSSIFEAIGTGATILFDGTEGGKLDMLTSSTSQPLNGFAEITYNKLAYWNTTGNNHTIQAPTAPTMAPNANDEVTLTKLYADGEIKYSIVYADGTTGVSDATYSAPFAMSAPGTVTAWVEANNTTTSTVKGKYFGYKDAPFTMLAGGTKNPELIPAIETGDNIDIATSNPYISSDEGVATFDSGVITAVKVGNATLTTTLQTTGAAENVIILNHNNQFETVVKVEKECNFVTFAEGQSYATFCNSDAEDWSLPEGIKAYAVQIPSSGNEVILKSIGFIPGTVDSSQPIYTPVLLMREDASNSSFGTVTKYVRQSGDEIPVNHLKFTTADKTTDGSQFILYNNEFVKAKGTISGPACYLENTSGNPARYFTIGDDDATAIDNVKLTIDDEADAQWYDLQGRKIQKPTKAGLYIMNGKKKVVNNK